MIRERKQNIDKKRSNPVVQRQNAISCKKRTGHRWRLREKFLIGGLKGFLDYEIVELLLTLGTPRRDCKDQAKEAMRRFKVLRRVLEADEEELLEKLYKIIKEKGSNYPKHFDLLLKRLKIRNPARFVAAAVGAYHDTKASIQPFPDVPSTLLELKDIGYRLFVASNGLAVKQWDKLARLRIALYFEDVFVSEEIGSEKGQKFYKSMLKRIKAKPDECVMIGDREDMDIKPAKKVGIHTIRVLRGKYKKAPTKADATIKDFRALPSTVLKLSR